MYPTAYTVLENLTKTLDSCDATAHVKWKIDDVCNLYSIFDWHKDNLTCSDLTKMKTFCTLAIALGFDGYVCFKVGDSYGTNGMWAFKDKSETGYSPDGDFIYRSFSPHRTYYAISNNGTIYPPRETYDSWHKPSDLVKYIGAEYRKG